MSRLRILVLTNMYPPHHYGGYELSCRDCVGRWRRTGRDVTVLTSTMRVPGVADVADERSDAGVRRDLRLYFRDADLYQPALPVRPLWEWHNQRTLRRALAEVRPDVVSIWHMGALSMGLLDTLVESGVPLVYAVCDDWPIYGVDLDGWLRLFKHRAGVMQRVAPVVRRLGLATGLPDVGRSGSFLFVSDVERRRCEEHSVWTYPDSTVVYSGIDRDDFPPVVGAAPSDGRRAWRGRLLFVGRLDDRKGIETAIRSLAHLPPEWTLSIVGGGNDTYRAKLERVTAEAGLSSRVSFSVVPRSELRQVYADADVVLFPSEWEEPFGLVPVEAMACATPVVATGTGGSGEFLADGVNCVLFPAGDAAALAGAVRRLADDPVLRARIVAGGLVTADDLTVDRLADVFDAWHVAAATGFANGRPADRPRPGTVSAP